MEVFIGLLFNLMVLCGRGLNWMKILSILVLFFVWGIYVLWKSYFWVGGIVGV